MASIDTDRLLTDFISIRGAARTLPLNSYKYGPLNARAVLGVGVRSTAQSYLAVMEEAASGQPNPHMADDPISSMLGYDYKRPTLSPGFIAMAKELGMDTFDPTRWEKFIGAFDAKYGEPTELRDSTKLYGALEAGLTALAGSKEKYQELVARHYPLSATTAPIPFNQLPAELQQHQRNYDALENIRKEEELRRQQLLQEQRQQAVQPEVKPEVKTGEKPAGAPAEAPAVQPVQPSVAPEYQPMRTPFLNRETGAIETHGGPEGKAKADCLTEKLGGTLTTDVDTCVRQKLSAVPANP